MTRTYHVLNLGAGVQSTTLYLMALGGDLPCDVAIFADTGDEPKAVYEHLAWLQSLNGPPIWVRSRGRLSNDLKSARRFASIPAFTLMTGDVGRTRRQCSKEYKVQVIERAIRREVCGLKPGARLPKDVTLIQYVGISLDEAGRFTRLKARRLLGEMRAPLIERFMTRAACQTWLAEFGNVPHEVPRSACVYCPFHDDAEWLRVKAVPEDWALALEVDAAMRTKGNSVNRNMDAEMFLHKSCQPLVQIDFKPKPVDDRQASIPFWRECLGVCGV